MEVMWKVKWGVDALFVGRGLKWEVGWGVSEGGGASDLEALGNVGRS